MAERSVRHRDKAGNVVEPSEAVFTDWLPMSEFHGGPEHFAPTTEAGYTTAADSLCP
jgi:hypothetical protein